ncbi:30S ribosomal protein S6 [Candidatus Parcubacteria bacterium]|nr:MAG: 30S ribosomal protein S6 [Candidatus Parcubacteria bacterium]
MNHYELLFLLPGNLLDEEQEKIRQMVKNLVIQNGGKITFEDNLGKKKLSYPVKKNAQGVYLLFELDIESDKIKKLSNEIKLTPKVLRHIIVKKSLTLKKQVNRALERLESPITGVKDDKKKEDKKVKIEDLDKKLDEILQGDII